MGYKGIFVTGTDTGIGKTQVASGLAAALQRRFSVNGTNSKVQLWKPVQTGVYPGDKTADSYLLRMGSGCAQAESDMASITLPDPLAPWMASQRAGTPIDYDGLAEEGSKRIGRGDYLIIEGVGGLAVPLTENKHIGNLAKQLDLPVVIVARTGLGTVNHTLLTLSFAKMLGIETAGIILNGYQDRTEKSLHENCVMIERFGGVPVIGMLPWFPCNITEPSEWTGWREQWLKIIEEFVDLGCLV